MKVNDAGRKGREEQGAFELLIAPLARMLTPDRCPGAAVGSP